MYKKYLITGVAGFIGFSSSKLLLEKGHKVFGIDNLDNYYSVNLKRKRLNYLKKNNNFKFNLINIEDIDYLSFLKK